MGGRASVGDLEEKTYEDAERHQNEYELPHVEQCDTALFSNDLPFILPAFCEFPFSLLFIFLLPFPFLSPISLATLPVLPPFFLALISGPFFDAFPLCVPIPCPPIPCPPISCPPIPPCFPPPISCPPIPPCFPPPIPPDGSPPIPPRGPPRIPPPISPPPIPLLLIPAIIFWPCPLFFRSSKRLIISPNPL
ncbi:hypothetical protein B566_EDAN015784 [Ephemera danica]|nr:hypothetical protein B566_EDAN015784 [Ephemera danica]